MVGAFFCCCCYKCKQQVENFICPTYICLLDALDSTPAPAPTKKKLYIKKRTEFLLFI